MDLINKIITRIPASIRLAFKEAGRIVLMALVSYAIAYLIALPQSETVLIGTIALRAVDKFLHDYGKETGNEKLVKGLTRF